MTGVDAMLHMVSLSPMFSFPIFLRGALSKKVVSHAFRRELRIMIAQAQSFGKKYQGNECALGIRPRSRIDHRTWPLARIDVSSCHSTHLRLYGVTFFFFHTCCGSPTGFSAGSVVSHICPYHRSHADGPLAQSLAIAVMALATAPPGA